MRKICRLAMKNAKTCYTTSASKNDVILIKTNFHKIVTQLKFGKIINTLL